MTIDDPFMDRIFYVCGGSKLFSILWGVILLTILKYKKVAAKKGCQESARSIILPLYEPLVYLLIGTLIVEATLFTLSHLHVFTTTTAFTWGMYEFIRDGFPMIFLQRSVSHAAFKRAALWVLLPTLYGVAVGLMVQLGVNDYLCSFLFEGGATLYYLVLILFVRLKKQRESILPYLWFNAVYRPLWVLYYVQQLLGGTWKNLYWPVLIAIGLMEFPLTGIWYFTLLQDTVYWRSGAPKSYRYAQSKLLETHAVGLLSTTGDSVLQTLQNMIENSHRQLIDFAHIDIHEDKVLGSGAYSRVYAGTYKKTPVAIKFFSSLTEVTERTIALYEKETAIMAAMQHPNIVKFYGLCVRPPTIFLIMEKCALGSLYTLLSNNVVLTLRQRLRMALDACCAIAHLHKLGFIHRDIKSLNFLVTDRLRLKLTDFGLSRKVALCDGTDQAVAELEEAPVAETTVDVLASTTSGVETDDRLVSKHDYMTRRVGTGLWMSPEMLQSKAYSEKTDIYSLSLVLWEIFAGVPPFEEVRTAHLQQAICIEHHRPVVPEDCPPDYRALIERGWSLNPAARPTALEMCAVMEKLLRHTIALELTDTPALRNALATTPRHSVSSSEGSRLPPGAMRGPEALESSSSSGSGASLSDIEGAIDINADEHYKPVSTPHAYRYGSSSSGSGGTSSHAASSKMTSSLPSSNKTSDGNEYLYLSRSINAAAG